MNYWSFFWIPIASLLLGHATVVFGAPQLVTLQNGGSEIHLSKVDGSDDQVLAENFSPYSYALYNGQDTTRLFVGTTYNIYSVNLDGTDAQRIDLRNILGDNLVVVAVDSDAGKLYFHKNLGPIVRSDLNGQNPETVIPADTLRDIEVMRLDSTNQKIYWTDSNGVSRANYDGSAIELLVDATQFDHPYANVLAADFGGGKLFFATSQFIYSANLDGSSVTQLTPISPADSDITIDFIRHLEVDPANDRLYWNCEEVDVANLCEAHLDGSNAAVGGSLFFGFRSVTSFIVKGGDSNPLFVFGEHRGEESVVRRSLDASEESVIIRGDFSAQDLALYTDLGFFNIYWTDTSRGAIMMMTPGSLFGHEIVSGLSYPYGLFIDRDLKKIYWTDYYTGLLQRANLDGSGIEDLVSGLQFPGDLSIDLTRNTAYWVANGSTLQSTILGSARLRTVTSVNVLSGQSIVIDPIANYLYGNINGESEIERINPRNGRRKTLATIPSVLSCGRFGCFHNPAVATDISFLQPAKLLYWSVPNAAQSIIQADKNGDDPRALGSSTLVYKFQFTTFPQDDVPPVISNIKVTQKRGKLTLKWKTNERTDAAIEYGEYPSFGNFKYESSSRRRPKKSHKIAIVIPDSVPTGSNYFFSIRSRDGYGNLSVWESFVTVP